MVKSELKNTVTAFGRLLEYSSNKRYGRLNRPFTNDPIDDIALRVNQDIKQTKGLDLLELENQQVLQEYESIVDSLLTNFTYSHIINPDKKEKQKLVESSYPVTPDFFRDLDTRVSMAITDILQRGDITPRDMIEYSKSADSVVANNLMNDYPRIAFATKRIVYRGKECVVFFLLSHVYPNPSNPAPDHWFIESFGLFSHEPYLEVASSPIDVFFLFLEDYGTDLEIDGNKYRFIYSKTQPRDFDVKQDVTEIKWKATINEGNALHTHFSNLKDSVSLHATYMIRQERHLKDIRQGNI